MTLSATSEGGNSRLQCTSNIPRKKSALYAQSTMVGHPERGGPWRTPALGVSASGLKARAVFCVCGLAGVSCCARLYLLQGYEGTSHQNVLTPNRWAAGRARATGRPCDVNFYVLSIKKLIFCSGLRSLSTSCTYTAALAPWNTLIEHCGQLSFLDHLGPACLSASGQRFKIDAHLKPYVLPSPVTRVRVSAVCSAQARVRRLCPPAPALRPPARVRRLVRID